MSQITLLSIILHLLVAVIKLEFVVIVLLKVYAISTRFNQKEFKLLR